jgi:hypothetical protein
MPAPHIQLPFVLPLIIAAALGAVAWTVIRFSLRTLLIATTLVAVALGLIIAVAR